jgi:ABC-type phosphate transport system substrate-binding protein
MRKCLPLILLLLCACGKPEVQSTSETATVGQFELVADEVLKPVIDSLVQGFTIECPDAKITVKYVSAGEAVRELMNHQARAIIIDRYFTSQERDVMAKDSVEIPAFKMAEDGIGCIVGSRGMESTVRLSDIVKGMKVLMCLTTWQWASSALPGSMNSKIRTTRA